jgi:hypothetical protein
MNIKNITDDSVGDPQTQHLTESATRLRKVLDTRHIDYETTIMLIDILAKMDIVFRDGFRTNDPTDLKKTMGYWEGAAVGAALSDGPDQPASWWKDERLNHHHGAEYEQRMYDLARLIAPHPDVASVR